MENEILYVDFKKYSITSNLLELESKIYKNRLFKNKYSNFIFMTINIEIDDELDNGELSINCSYFNRIEEEPTANVIKTNFLQFNKFCTSLIGYDNNITNFIFINNFNNNLDNSFLIRNTLYNLVGIFHNLDRYKNIIGFNKHKPYLEMKANNYSLDLYNVGNACFTTISFDGKPHIIIDFGYEKQMNESVKNVMDDLQNVKYIILSHYHFDHCNLFDNMKVDFNKVVWIIPEFDSSDSLLEKNKFIKHFLEKIENLSNVIYAKNIIKNEYITFYNYEYKHKTEENKKSLAVLLKINNKNILFPGDAPYNLFEYNLKNIKVDYMICSHHCYDYPRMINVKAEELTFINCSTPCNIKHNHPSKSHLLQLNNPHRFTDGKCYYFDGKTKVEDTISDLWLGEVRHIKL